MARFNDLESGFEKNLALAYGRHIITGHPIEHSIGLEGGAASDIPNADTRTVLKVALGDGAPDVDGEGAWCGPVITLPTESEGCDTGPLADAVYSEPHDNLTVHENGEVEKTGGDDGTYDADAYATPSFHGSQCIDVQWEATEDKHTQNAAVFMEAYPVSLANRNGMALEWFFNTVPIYQLIKAGVNFGSFLGYEFPCGFRISTDGEGNGALWVADGGIPLDQDWGSAAATFTYDIDLVYRVRVAVAGIAGIPGATNAAVRLAIAEFTGGSIEPGGTCSLEVIYAGETIPAENYHLHAGTLSTGKDDDLQGIDSFFPNGLTYNGTVYITVILPEGIDEDADPSKLAVLIYTSQISDYDEDGVRTAIAYSPNPARVKANALRRIGQHQRIYWPSFIASREYYDTEIEAPVGSENTYDPFDDVPTYDVLGPITADAGTGAIARNSGSGYDNRAISQQRIVGGQDGGFSVTLGGAFPTGTGGGEMALVDENGTTYFGISWGNGHLGVYANGVGIEDRTIAYDLPAAAGDVIDLVVEAGLFLLKQNGITETIPQGAAPAPDDVDLFGRIILWAAGAAVTASNFTGQTVGASTPTTAMIPRFEAHPAFTGPVDIATFLDYVDQLCASDTQDAGRYIVFLTPETRASVHTFDEETNVVGRSIKVRTVDIRNRPNRLWAQFRNLDLRYLDRDSVFDLRDGLFDKVGRPIDPGALNFGSMRMSQAQRLIKYEMRRRSDRKIFEELTGMDDSFHVLPADVVTVISRKHKVRVDGGFDDEATEIELVAGEGAKLPAVPFFTRWWNKTDYNEPTRDPNVEIIQVTAVDGDTLTIERAQQGTDASTKNIADKQYVLDRFPKLFLVISATRESPESIPAGLRRNFQLQEYVPGDYRDDDHEVPQPPLGVQPPSPFSGPGAPVLLLDQSTVESVGGAFVTKILGTVYFATFPTAHFAKIYVTKPGDVEMDTGIIVNPVPGSTFGTFEYPPDVLGEYTFRAEARAATGVVGGSATASILIADLIFNPDTEALLFNPDTNSLLLAR